MSEVIGMGSVIKTFPQKKEVLIEIILIKSGKPLYILKNITKIKRKKFLFNKDTFLVLDSDKNIRVKRKYLFSKKEISKVLKDLEKLSGTF